MVEPKIRGKNGTKLRRRVSYWPSVCLSSPLILLFGRLGKGCCPALPFCSLATQRTENGGFAIRLIAARACARFANGGALLRCAVR